MKSLLLFLTLLLLSGASFAQKVTFDDYKKRGDACFVKLDYQCAKDNYERALRIRDNDAYCKSQLKKANDALKKASTQTVPKKTLPKVEKESENIRIAELNRKEGDDLFKRGDYEAAQKKYEACLNVPSFGSDAYVKEQIKFSRLAAAFQTDAKNALARGNGLEGLAYLKKILEINSGDPITRRLITEHLQQRGNQQFAKNQYTEAKKSYEEALPYADIQTKAVLANLINTTEKELKADADKKVEAAKVAKQEPKTTPKEPVETQKSVDNKPAEAITRPEVVKKETKPIQEVKLPTAPKRNLVPKIAVGAMGVGAGVYAFMLRSQYNSKLEAYYALGTGRAEYANWKNAYQEVKDAQGKTKIYNICLGVAAGAIIAETILLLKKPKARSSALRIEPTSENWGIALQYRF